MFDSWSLSTLSQGEKMTCVADSEQVDLLICGHYYYYFQYYNMMQKLLVMIDSKQDDLL